MAEINWKYNIGDQIVDYNQDGTLRRNFTIISRETRNLKRINKHLNKGFQMSNCKYYKYKCNICGWDDGWMEERHLYHGKQGCSCCRGKTTVRGINDIATTHPFLINYFQNKDDAYVYAAHSDYCPMLVCPNCGHTKTNLKLDTLTKYGFGCPVCADGISYGEKFINMLLRQLGVTYKTQLSRTTYQWCGKYKYDFWFKNKNEEYIIEVHGEQHYKVKNGWAESAKNDKDKETLANINGFDHKHYIVLNCKYSTFNWVKTSIINSELNTIFNLNVIDWERCHKHSLKSYVKDVCDYWNQNTNETVLDLAKVFGVAPLTIRTYLRNGEALGWCKYDTADKIRRHGKLKSQKVVVLNNDFQIICKCNSAAAASREIERFCDEKFDESSVRRVCSTKLSHLYKGYYFWYLEDYIKVFGEDSLQDIA